MTPRTERIFFIVGLALAVFAAGNLWFGASSMQALIRDWSLHVPAYAEPVLVFHRAFVAVPLLVIAVWVLPATRGYRGWLSLALGAFGVAALAAIWIPVFSTTHVVIG